MASMIEILVPSKCIPKSVIPFFFFQGSYSTDNVDLRIAGGPYIYKGFMIKGRVNILGWEIYAHIKLSDTVRNFQLLVPFYGCFQRSICDLVLEVKWLANPTAVIYFRYVDIRELETAA